jgi:peptidoglycan/LPS O-acetylase OafA/YrhL
VLDHAFGWPEGGFVGVDVFFVISGFLITGLLLREHERTGRISFAGFYRRRIRRILPMSTLVLLLTVAATSLVYFAGRTRDVALDGIWSLLFAANWRFASTGTDYFASTQEPSPLQHFWSLAVEEQFYFAWPWILLVALVAVARLRSSRRRVIVLFAVASLVTVASFLWAVHETAASPTVAYFSTLSRAWELLLGALAAIAAPALAHLPHAWRQVIGHAGLLAIVGGALLIDPATGFPAPWALLPVLGATAVAVAGSGLREGLRMPLLANPVGAYLGRISYSLYLWHWPVIVLLTALMPVDRLLHRGLAVILAIGLSVLSYHAIEDPIRHSRWLEPRTAAPRPRPVHAVPWRPVVAGGLTLALATTAVVSLNGHYRAIAAANVPVATPVPTGVGVVGELEAEVATAAQATTWPALTPDVSLIPASRPPQLDDPACVNDWGVTGQHCVYGAADAPNRAMLVGDSTAISWLPGLELALKPAGWSIDSYGKYGCPSVSTTVRSIDRTPYAGCDEHRSWALEQVVEQAPDLVVFGSAEGYVDNLPSGATGDDAVDEWADALRASIDTVAPTGARVVVLSAPPSAADLTQCWTRASTPGDCLTQIQGPWHRTAEAEQRAVAEARADGLDVEYVDTHTWVCTADGACPGFADGLVIRSDINHLTAQYSERLAPLLAERLLASG